jgi:hypothetical protein
MRTSVATSAGILLALSLAFAGHAANGSGSLGLPSVPRLQGTSAAGHSPSADEARALFERLKLLQGMWRGKSTKGWMDRVSIKVIAGGSAILFDSFDAHPNETMLTLIHLDGDRLLLTHYCVAGNQPRMLASSIADGGARVTFSFLDGTNLPSRDTGHMDSATFEFRDPGHYTEQWSWYQKGAERWMEQIEMERLPDAAKTSR